MDLDKFLQKSKQEDLNKCVIEKCGPTSCKKETNLINVVLDCQTQRLGPKMEAHRCNVLCSSGYDIKSDWALVKLYKDDVHHTFIKEFFQSNEEAFGRVNDCIVEQSKILIDAKNVADVKKKLPMFQEKKGQHIIQRCLTQELKKKYDKTHLQHGTCMYKCYYFNNMVNNLPFSPAFKVPKPNADIFIENQILNYNKKK